MNFHIGDKVFFLQDNQPVFGTIEEFHLHGAMILTEKSRVFLPLDDIKHVPNLLKIISLTDLIKLRELAGASMLRLENPHWSGGLQANTVVCLGCDKINLDGEIEHKKDCHFAQLWDRTDPVKLKNVENEI